MTRIGVLALQGSVVEHMKMLSRLDGVKPVEVRDTTELSSVEGLIIPGGESTTIGKLINEFNLLDPIREFALKGKPVWGTCAGMILLAKTIMNEETTHLGLMDIIVKRNAYGSQLDSFVTFETVPDISPEKIPMVFIRAPWVEQTGPEVQILAEIDRKIVAVRQKHLLATSFHPELTDNSTFHQYFLQMIKKAL